MAATWQKDLTLYRRLWRQARPYWLHIAAIFAISLLSTPLALLAPVPLKIAVDSVLGAKPLPGLVALLVPAAVRGSRGALLAGVVCLVVLIALLRQLQGLVSGWLQAYTGENLVRAFRARLFRHVQRLSLAYHDTKGTSDSTYRIQYDARSIQYIAINGVFPFVTAACTILAMLVITATISWPLALVPLAVAPIVFLLVRESRRRLRYRWSAAKEIESSAMSVVQEALSSVRVVKAFGREDHEHGRFVRHSDEGARGQVNIALTSGVFDVLVGVTIALGTAVALWVGVGRVQAGVISLGELLIVMSYLAQLYSPLDTLSKKTSQLQSSLASAERAFALLDEAPDVPEAVHAKPVARADGNLRFCRVSFSYADERPLLKNLSFDIPAGTRVAITGTSGAGKTTLASLLTRFYDPTTGEILLDGVNLKDYRLADLRNQFAMVLQEPVLFSTTIAENIAYARPEAGESEIIAAARAANAHEFITALPDGYATMVGERGMRLSGGERQRISLARAFLKDAPILILDEPTSSVDVKTEAILMEAMERLMTGRTSFTIAHRLSTIKNCDVRLHLESSQYEIRPALAPPAKGESEWAAAATPV